MALHGTEEPSFLPCLVPDDGNLHRLILGLLTQSRSTDGTPGGLPVTLPEALMNSGPYKLLSGWAASQEPVCNCLPIFLFCPCQTVDPDVVRGWLGWTTGESATSVMSWPACLFLQRATLSEHTAQDTQRLLASSFNKYSPEAINTEQQRCLDGVGAQEGKGAPEGRTGRRAVFWVTVPSLGQVWYWCV